MHNAASLDTMVDFPLSNFRQPSTVSQKLYWRTDFYVFKKEKYLF